MNNNDLSEPAKFLRYCPHCGSASFRAVSPKEFKCDNCGFNFFTNSAAAVVAVIFDNEGRLLLTRRARNPFKGWLDLPGGFVDPGESAETALRRELMEELQTEVKSAKFLCSHPNEYIFSNYKIRTTDLGFICEMTHKPTKCADDVDALIWLHPAEINLDQIAFPSIRNIVQTAITIAQHT